jgi:hypothetical protein
MEQPKLNLKKIRDFGEVINDTFIFLKQNFKPLFKILIPISIVFVIAQIAFATIQIINLQDTFKASGADSSAFLKKTFSSSLITGSFSMITYFVVALTTYCYIAVYVENKSETPSMEQVWGFFKFYILRYLGIRLLTGVFLILGFMLCLLPGIYLMPILSLIVASVVLENSSTGYALNRGFKLIKENWWMCFGTLLILVMILYAITITLMIPSIILGGGTGLFAPSFERPIYAIVIQNIITGISIYSYVILIIGNSILFYSMIEKKESEGLLDRINDLGASSSSNQFPKEEY